MGDVWKVTRVCVPRDLDGNIVWKECGVRAILPTKNQTRSRYISVDRITDFTVLEIIANKIAASEGVNQVSFHGITSYSDSTIASILNVFTQYKASFKALDLSETSVSRESSVALIAFVRENTLLETLDLSGCTEREEFIQSLRAIGFQGEIK
jgi:hypothetical protein